jgi:hypothetical protein
MGLFNCLADKLVGKKQRKEAALMAYWIVLALFYGFGILDNLAK